MPANLVGGDPADLSSYIRNTTPSDDYTTVTEVYRRNAEYVTKFVCNISDRHVICSSGGYVP